MTDDTDTPGASAAAVSFAALFTADAGADGGSTAYALSITGGNGTDSGLVDVLTGAHILLRVDASGDIEGYLAGAPGTVAFRIDLDPATGMIGLTQDRAITHDDPLDPVEDGASAATLAAGLIVLTATITDGDGDTASATAEIGGAFAFEDDGPTALAGSQTATVDDEGLSGGIPAGPGDAPGEATTATGNVSGFFAAGADQPLTYHLLTNTSGLPTLKSGGVTLSYNVSGNILTASAGVDPVFTFTLNATTGQWDFELLKPLDHSAAGTEDEITLQLGGLIQAKDADGDTVTAIATLSIVVDDDSPTAFTTQAVGSGLINAAGSTVTRNLDTDANINNNVGADQPGKIRFANITNGQDTVLKAGGVTIELWLSNDGQTLQGRTGSTDGTDGTLIYTVQLNQAAGTYTVTMAGAIDNGSGVSFNDLSGGDAGNPSFKIVQSTSADNLEILFTPINENTINSDSDDVAAGGQFIDIGNPDKGLRIDFGDFTFHANGGGGNDDRFSIQGHTTVNGFRFTIDQVSNGTTADVRLVAINADEDGGVQQLLPSSAGDTTQSITVVKIYNAANVLIGTATRVGPDGGDATFGGVTVDFEAGGTVLVTQLLSDYSVQTYTASGYDRLEITNAGTTGGGSNDGKFSLSQLQIETISTGSPVNLNFDLSLTDYDGDSVNGSVAITVNPVPPIVLDLDGDGAEFSSLAAAVRFDYGADGFAEGTAWAAPDDGLLAIDLNGDGIVNDGSEIVFGGDGLTDLEGLAARYDSNGDKVLDAQDLEFAKFGVWQDANGNGVTDAGEFRSLTEMGIASISLVSDGQGYLAADGDVTVHGTGSYVRTDGTVGSLADVSFATEGEKLIARNAEIAVTAAAASALLSVSVAAAPPVEDQVSPAGTVAITGDAVENPVADVQTEEGPAVTPAADLLTESDLPQGQPADDGAHHDEPAVDTDIGRLIDHFTGVAAPDAGADTGQVSDSLFAFTNPASSDAMHVQMDAPAVPQASQDSLAVVTEAFAETAAHDFVDKLITQLAGGADADQPASGEAHDAALFAALAANVEPSQTFVPEAMDLSQLGHEAAMAAAQA